MADGFEFDVFLSHSTKDKAIVRPIAERLRQDGLTVWFDEWVLKPGDSIPAKIEEGLEHSRVLVLCMSANAFGSDWACLESYTFRFRDPLNKERCFLPLRLDDAPIKGSLLQFVCIDWRPADHEQKYARLLEACRQSSNATDTPAVAHIPGEKTGEAHHTVEIGTKKGTCTAEQATDEIHVITDSSLLLSADSFLQPGIKDPEAERDFRFVADVYCNKCSLALRVPNAPAEDCPPLMALWTKEGPSYPVSKDDKDHRTVEYDDKDPHIVEYTEKGKSETIQDLVGKFMEFSSRRACDVLNWLRFQFRDNDLANIFWVNKNNTVDELCDLRSRIEAIPGATGPGTLYRSITDSDLHIPSQHDHAMERFCRDRAWYGVCYAFHAFEKGHFYCMELPPRSTYQSHWLRREIVESYEKSDSAAEMCRKLFRWGTILQKVFAPSDGLLNRDRQTIITVFKGLREYSACRGQTILGSADVEFNELEEFAIDAILQTDVVPRRKRGEWEERLRSIIRTVMKEKAGGLFRYLGSEPVVYRVKRHLIRYPKRLAFDFVRRFNRAKLWDHYEDPGIQDAVRDFVKNRDQ